MQRNAKFDNVKFFLMCCVVFGHIANRFADDSYAVACIQFWVYLFHMPAFVYVAGLFSKRTVNENRWRKIVPYIFLYFGMLTLSFAVSAIKNGVANTTVDFFHENGIAWYSLAMFWWGAITILIKRVKPVYVLVISLFLSVISGYSADVNSFLVMQRTLIFFPFFYLGYITDLEQLVRRLDHLALKIASAAVLAVTGVLTYLYYDKIYYWRFLFRGIKPYDSIQKGLPYGWGWSWRLAFYLIAMTLTLAIICLMPNIKSFISALGKKTLPIYVFHGTFLALTLSTIKPLRNWMLSDLTCLKSLLFVVITVVVTSLPIFDIPLRKLMTVPMRVLPSKTKDDTPPTPPTQPDAPAQEPKELAEVTK